MKRMEQKAASSEYTARIERLSRFHAKENIFYGGFCLKKTTTTSKWLMKIGWGSTGSFLRLQPRNVKRIIFYLSWFDPVFVPFNPYESSGKMAKVFFVIFGHLFLCCWFYSLFFGCCCRCRFLRLLLMFWLIADENAHCHQDEHNKQKHFLFGLEHKHKRQLSINWLLSGAPCVKSIS